MYTNVRAFGACASLKSASGGATRRSRLELALRAFEFNGDNEAFINVIILASKRRR